jgi:uncharacterized lipoprotein YbaY
MPKRLLALLAALALAACNDSGSTEPDEPAASSPAPSTSTPAAEVTVTASHDSAAGAMTGLLEAMRSGDNDAVMSWLSPEPESDRASVTQTLRLQAMLGLDGKVFWLVDQRKIVDVSEEGEKAEVTLDGYLVWCTGSGADDEDASCAQPNGAGDTQSTTYEAVEVEGRWYVHLDLNRGQLIKGNPGLAGVAG